jgi:hypothetical protein
MHFTVECTAKLNWEEMIARRLRAKYVVVNGFKKQFLSSKAVGPPVNLKELAFLGTEFTNCAELLSKIFRYDGQEFDLYSNIYSVTNDFANLNFGVDLKV